MAKTMREIYEGLNVHVSFYPEDVALVYKFFDIQIPPNVDDAEKKSDELYSVLQDEKQNGITWAKLLHRIKKLKQKGEKEILKAKAKHNIQQ